jgi:hypothetical protein
MVRNSYVLSLNLDKLIDNAKIEKLIYDIKSFDFSQIDDYLQIFRRFNQRFYLKEQKFVKIDFFKIDVKSLEIKNTALSVFNCFFPMSNLNELVVKDT